MRLGVYTNLGYNDPIEWARQMKKIGCGSVIFPVDYTHDEKIIKAYVRAAKEYDLVIAEVGVWCNPISLNDGERISSIKRCKEQLRLADYVDANCCVNVAGSTGERWDGAYKDNFSEEAWYKTVKVIQEIIDDVQPKHTYYAIEPMPCMYPMNPDQYLDLIKCVDRERFAVHMDIFNWITDPNKYFFHEEFMEECFEKLGPYIKSCHIKDIALLKEATFQLKEITCGEGQICLEKYALLAEAYSSDMPMIIEHLSSKEEYIESMAYVRHRLETSGVSLI